MGRLGVVDNPTRTADDEVLLQAAEELGVGDAFRCPRRDTATATVLPTG